MVDLFFALVVYAVVAAWHGWGWGVVAAAGFYLYRVAKRPYTHCWLWGVPGLHRDVDAAGKNWGVWCPLCGGKGTRRRVVAVLLGRGKRLPS